jgi:hypothetical protein
MPEPEEGGTKITRPKRIQSGDTELRKLRYLVLKIK